MRRVFAFQKKQARRRGIRSPETLGLCFLQRFGSLLQLNPHGHAVVPDGVFALDPTATLQFVCLPPPTMAELEAVGLGIVKGIRRALDRALARARDDEDQALLQTLSEAARAALSAANRRDGHTVVDDDHDEPRSSRRTAKLAALIQERMEWRVPRSAEA
jgi:hypothetical protein